jgi:hypothetical protein
MENIVINVIYLFIEKNLLYTLSNFFIAFLDTLIEAGVPTVTVISVTAFLFCCFCCFDKNKCKKKFPCFIQKITPSEDAEQLKDSIESKETIQNESIFQSHSEVIRASNTNQATKEYHPYYYIEN